jgi:NADP-dependent aldehyde dehydrogenase
MNDVPSIDPKTGRVVEVVARETEPAQLEAICRTAAAAAGPLEQLGRRGRSHLLREMAKALEAQREAIVRLADRETALGSTRLNGELNRTSFQLRMFAEVLEEGGYLEAAIDHPGTTAMGPRPDLRRMLFPIGPVAVFGASNFPLAFSVPGGDTAAALAAGCPVIVKAHPSHPATSQLCFEVLQAAAAAASAPEGTIALVHGFEAGAALVAHPVVRAVGFTGSLGAAQALVRIIEGRPDPIPFFGELSSLNPVVVTPAAAEERAAELARGLVDSYTLGAGQFCTKPGLVLVPSGAAGDALADAMKDATSQRGAQILLNGGIAAGFGKGLDRLESAPGVEILARGQDGAGQGFEAVPTLLTAPARALAAEVTEECFGPVTVVVRYSSAEELLSTVEELPASLTATIHRGHQETELPARVSDALRHRTGRLLFDGFPTGVAVSWAQHHGGPWPSTNSQHTSVGATAVRRFLRPVTWQDAPPELLPPELRDDAVDVPRRVDGRLQVPPPLGDTDPLLIAAGAPGAGA